MRVCYAVVATGFRIALTTVQVDEYGSDSQNLIVNRTSRTSTSASCYDVSATPQAVAGPNCLGLNIGNGPGAARSLYVYLVTLTVTPLAAGAAEVPDDGSGVTGKP